MAVNKQQMPPLLLYFLVFFYYVIYYFFIIIIIPFYTENPETPGGKKRYHRQKYPHTSPGTLYFFSTWPDLQSITHTVSPPQVATDCVQAPVFTKAKSL